MIGLSSILPAFLLAHYWGCFLYKQTGGKYGFTYFLFFCGIFGAVPTSEILKSLLPLERDPHPAIGAALCSGFFISLVDIWMKKVKK